MNQQLRVIELAPKPVGELPLELKPAYERPLDRASIDARMDEQVAWEDIGRTAPRDSLADLDPKQRRNLGERARRALALGSLMAIGAGATVYMLDRAASQNRYEHYKLDPPTLVGDSAKH